jgi:PPM family protein phosphatase
MSLFETATITEAYQRRCEDRVAVFEDTDRVVLVVADGAGGMSQGDQAAEAVIREVKTAYPRTSSREAWASLLAQIDGRIGAGESTAVVVDVSLSGICGASVGDSQAWLIKDGEIAIFTAQQNRKPLLGSGRSSPVGFSASALDGILLVATDGFCNYVKRPDVIKTVSQSKFAELPRKLLEMVRPKSGPLWDDVGIAVCRMRPPAKPGKQRYSLESD